MAAVTLRACLVVLACSLVVPTAAAQDDATERARVHFEAGTRAFDTGDYELAVTEFERAYELTHHPDLLFNIYSSAERAGHLERAADALTRFLAEGQLEEERRPVLQERLARLRERIAASEGREPQPTEAQGTAVPEPSVETSEPEPAAAAPSGVHPAGIVTLITAGVLAASFAVFAGLSEMEDGALTERCGTSCTSEEVQTLMVYNTIADVSWITAAVAGVAGVVLLFALPPEGGSQTAIAPWATPYAGGLTATGRW